MEKRFRYGYFSTSYRAECRLWDMKILFNPPAPKIKVDTNLSCAWRTMHLLQAATVLGIHSKKALIAETSTKKKKRTDTSILYANKRKYTECCEILLVTMAFSQSSTIISNIPLPHCAAEIQFLEKNLGQLKYYSMQETHPQHLL